jgi:putative phosphoesterase
MRLGLVADTHGHFDPALAKLFAGCDRVLHAGDVMGNEILALISCIAPVTAVRGNCDSAELGAGLPDEAVLSAEALTLYLVHAVGTSQWPKAPVREAIDRSQTNVVVYGHSHKPAIELIDQILYVNPGSAGPRRFDLPRSAGLLTVNRRHARVEVFDLEHESLPLLLGPFEAEL